MKIRLSGTPAELDAGIDRIRETWTVTYTSRLFNDRINTGEYRVYLGVTAPAPRAAAPSPAQVAEQLRRAAEARQHRHEDDANAS